MIINESRTQKFTITTAANRDGFILEHDFMVRSEDGETIKESLSFGKYEDLQDNLAEMLQYISEQFIWNEKYGNTNINITWDKEGSKYDPNDKNSGIN